MGFERPEHSVKADGRSAFPFGSLVRKHGTAQDIIEIQFDKYSKPKFIINFRKTHLTSLKKDVPNLEAISGLKPKLSGCTLGQNRQVGLPCGHSSAFAPPTHLRKKL